MSQPPPHLATPRAFITQLLDSLPAQPQHPAHSASATNDATASNRLNAVPDTAKKQFLTLHVLFPNELLPALDLLDRRLVTRFRIRRNSQQSEQDHDHTVPYGRNVAQSTIKRGVEGQPEDEDAARTINDVAAQVETLAPTAAGQDNPSNPDVEMLDRGPDVPHARVEDEEPEEVTHFPQIADSETRIEGEEAPGCLTAQQQQKHADTVYYVRSAQQRSSRYSTSYESTTSYEVRLTAWNCSCPAFAFAAFPSVHPEPAVPEVEIEFDEVLRGIGCVGLDDVKAVQNGGWRFGGVSLGEGMPPVCKHLLACVLVERCGMFTGFVEEKEVSAEEAVGWAAGWGD